LIQLDQPRVHYKHFEPIQLQHGHELWCRIQVVMLFSSMCYPIFSAYTIAFCPCAFNFLCVVFLKFDRHVPSHLFCTYYRIFFMCDQLFGCGISLSLTAMCHHILFVRTNKFFSMCGQLFVREILLSSTAMCYRIFCVYFVFFSSCAITFFVYIQSHFSPCAINCLCVTFLEARQPCAIACLV